MRVNWTREKYRQRIWDLASYLSVVLPTLGRKERRLAAAQYVSALLLPGRRKCIRPIADWLGTDHQSLQQLLTNSPWSYEALWSTMRRRLVSQIKKPDLWIVNQRSWAKQGKQSVGVSYQALGANTKKSSCQVSIEILVGQGTVATPAAGRLHLPESWCANPDRRDRVRVPAEVTSSTKPALAIELIAQMQDDGISRSPVLAESTFGNDAAFRGALRTAGFEYLLQIDAAACIGSTAPAREAPGPIQQLIWRTPFERWDRVFTADTGKPLKTMILWRRIVAHAASHEAHPCWLAVEWPEGSPAYCRAHLCHLEGAPTEETSALFGQSAECLRNYEQCFESILDLASYQGRTWSGFHHHMVLAAVACAFVFSGAGEEAGFRDSLPPPEPAIHREMERLAGLI